MSTSFPDQKIFSGTPMAMPDGTELTVFDEGGTENTVPRFYFQGLASEFPFKWGSLAQELGLEKERHIGFNPRGIGKSEGLPESLEQVTDDAAHVLGKLGVQSVQAVGHSYGGALATVFATRHPELTHSFVAMDSLPYLPEGAAKEADRRIAMIQTERGQKMLSIVGRFAFGDSFKAKNPALIQDYVSMLSRQNPNAYARYCEIGLRLDADLSHYPGPKLLMVGAEDHLPEPWVARKAAEEVGAAFVEIPNAGHNIAIEQPALVAEALRRFSATT